MSNCVYGPTKTWKVVYSLRDMSNGTTGVALVEADTKQQAMYTFQQEYAGQYFTIRKCEELLK